MHQNKKRKYGRDHDDDDVGRPRTPPEDPLKDATTLYVGNLYVEGHSCVAQNSIRAIDCLQIFLYY